MNVHISDGDAPIITFINPPQKTNGSPQFTWRSSEQAQFTCSLDNGPYKPCGSGMNGRWDKNNVGNGLHILSVRGEDGVGNVGRPTTHSWRVGKFTLFPSNYFAPNEVCQRYNTTTFNMLDAVAPTITFIDPAATTGRSPEFSWRSSEQATFECSFDGGSYEDCGRGTNGKWTEDNVDAGSHFLTVRGTDVVGNLGGTTTHTWIVGKSMSSNQYNRYNVFIILLYYVLIIVYNSLIIEIIKPAITFIQPSAVTNHYPTLKWSSTTNMYFMCSLDDELYKPCGQGRSGQWIGNNIADGSHVLKVRGTDRDGNVLAFETFTWTVSRGT